MPIVPFPVRRAVKKTSWLRSTPFISPFMAASMYLRNFAFPELLCQNAAARFILQKDKKLTDKDSILTAM
jgi:hypothetical protein